MRKGEAIPHWWTVFATEYMMNGQCAAHAYKKAKPHVTTDTAKTDASKLLAEPNFRQFLASFRQTCTERMGMRFNEWMGILMDCARIDTRSFLKVESGSGDTQLVDDWQDRPDGHALQEIQFATTTLESGAVVQRVKVKAVRKLEAARLIGLAQGFLKEKGDGVGMTSDEVLAMLMKVSNLTQEQRSKLKELPDARTIDVEIVE